MKRPSVREHRSRQALQAVLAAGHVGPFEGDLERDLREGKRQQREVKAAAAQDDRRDHGGERQREDHGKGQRHDLVRAAAHHGEGDGIARAAEEDRRAERHEAGIAHQQADAGAVERVDRDLRDQADRRADRDPQQAEAAQHQDGQENGMTERAIHSKRSQRSPSKPRGRSSSISAMKRYMTAPEASGQNWMVSATTTPTSRPAITAPANEPSPPIATTPKAGMMALVAIAGVTVQSGAASMPAMPEMAQPSPNTQVSTRGRLMPSRPTISGSREPARRMRPNGVFSRNSQSSRSTVAVVRSTPTRYLVIRIGPQTRKPAMKGGGLKGWPMPP